MSDKDFKVKNKLIVNGLNNASGVILATSNTLDSHNLLPTQYGGTGTTTSPSTGQILYSTAGSTYAPTALNTLDVKGSSYSDNSPANPVVGQIWVESDVNATTFDSNIIRRKTITSTAGQTVYVTDIAFIDGYEQVYLNGSLLVRESDYTTSTNNTITLLIASALNDIVEILSITNLNSINTYTQAELDTRLALKSNLSGLNTFTADQSINGIRVGKGGNSGASNTALGLSALITNTSGLLNTAIGIASLTLNTTGSSNAAIGSYTLANNTIGYENVAVGHGGLNTNTTGVGNTAIGYVSLLNNSIGQHNTAVGTYTLLANTTGRENTAIGAFALDSNTTGTVNVGVGFNSLATNTIGTSNTAIGAYSLLGNTTGDGNTAVGFYANQTNTTGYDNVSIGRFSMFRNTIGSQNVSIGRSSMEFNSTGNNNTAVGHYSLLANTVGFNNTSVGTGTLQNNTTGAENTAVGMQALYANTTGKDNAAVGMNALVSNTTGVSNVAIGRDSLIVNTTGSGNTALGSSRPGSYGAPLGQNITGLYNVAVGGGALHTSNGTSNVGVGFLAGYDVTTGSYNTFIGNEAGRDGINNITTGSNNTLLGSKARASSAAVSNTVTLGDLSITTLRCQVTSITSLSDARDKKNIESLPVGLNFINSLTPVKFDWNMRDGGKVDVPDTGFIAQDLVEIEDSSGIADYLQLTYRDNPDKLEASYGRLIPILVKAVQELSAEVKDLRSQLND